jgi:NAD(P)-dependent dehydrogenase (short-subunit alcohol dehydrogenase family)
MSVETTKALDGQVAVVTGAGAGLGRAYALALAAEGAAIVVNDIVPRSAQSTVEEIEAAGGRAVADSEPVGDSATAERLVEVALGQFGQLDVMVNNAGSDRRGPALDLTVDDWQYTLNVHLWGAIHGALAAGRAMRAAGRGGSIINVTSASFYIGARHMAPYCVAKGGIYSLTRSLAVELAPFGIAVNAVAPPFTDTAPAVAFVESLRETGTPAEQIEAMRASLVDPVDVAPIVVYLATPEGRRLRGYVFTQTGDVLESIQPPATTVVDRVSGSDGPWAIPELAKAVAQLT